MVSNHSVLREISNSVSKLKLTDKKYNDKLMLNNRYCIKRTFTIGNFNIIKKSQRYQCIRDKKDIYENLVVEKIIPQKKGTKITFGNFEINFN